MAVWRPVMARRLPSGAYLIVEQDYDRNTETWQFEPGTAVMCRTEKRNGRQIVIAPKMAHRSAAG